VSDPLTVRSQSVRSPGLTAPPGLLAPRPRTVADRRHSINVTYPAVGKGPPDEDFLSQAINDRSGSMGLGNDPSGLRQVALFGAAEAVAKSARRDREFLSLRSFDLTAPSDVGRVTLDRAGLRKLGDAINADQSCNGISAAGAALNATKAEAKAFDGTVSLLIMSDFQLSDTDHLAGWLGSYPADYIHLLVLTAPVPPVFVNHPKVTYSQIGWEDDPAEVALVIHRQMTVRRSAPATRRYSRAKSKKR
jgi:hypothetical protein